MAEDGVNPQNPVDTPLGAVDRNLRAEGFDGQFRAGRDGDLQCLTCGATFPASGQRADQVTRLEGASDPADMLVVVPLECPACRTTGTLIAHYGPEASEEETAVLLALERRPSEGSGSDATPGIPR